MGQLILTVLVSTLTFSIWMADADSICGRKFNNDTGVFLLPKRDDVDFSRPCNWSISVTDGYVIRLNSLFWRQRYCNMRYDRCDHLKVYDVPTNGRRMLRDKWCVDCIPDHFLSSSSAIELQLIFYIHSYRGRKEMFVSWSKVKATLIMTAGTQGTLTSPSYPSTYPENMNKTWEIIVPYSSYVVIKFNTFDLGRTDDKECQNDRVEIMERLLNNSFLSLGQWCGSVAPPYIKSRRSKLFVNFHTDNTTKNNGVGFLASWSSDSQCGGFFNTDKGVLSSPNHPFEYSKNTFCKWIINVTYGYVIELTFESRPRLRGCNQCDCDYVKVFDVMPTGQRTLKGNWCGFWRPPPFISSSSTIRVEFKSDDSWTYDGFMVSWKQIAKPPHTILEGPQGTFTSPTFKGTYPDNLNKRWEIIAPDLNHVVLEFNTFDLGIGIHRNCKHDNIEIFDVLHNNTLFSLGQWCESNAPKVIKSYNSRLIVDFSSDNNSSNNGQGFQASWKTDSTCGGSFSTDRGVLSSPYYPYTYNDNDFCTWRINVDEDHLILLTFMQPFDVGDTDQCHDDNVTVYDVLPSGQRYLRKIMCGQKHYVFHLTSLSSTIDLEFKTDGSFVEEGFGVSWLKLKIAKPQTILDGLQGTLTSPNYPCSYPDNLNKRWGIIVTRGQSVSLQFKSFDLGSEGNQSCQNDRIEIFEVLHNDSMLSLGQWCKSNTPPFIKSTGSKLFIDFYSDDNRNQNGKGFEAAWTSVSTCGGSFTTDRGVLLSPYYPYPNNENKDCEWRISVGEDHVIRLTIIEAFKVRSSHQCTRNNVKVYDVLPSGQRIFRELVCGFRFRDFEITSSSSIIDLEFKTDGSNRVKGFAATWLKIAKPLRKILVGHQGILTSPNHPFTYPENLKNRWEIIVPSGHQVSLEFKTFDLGREEDDSCQHDRIEIFEVLLNDSMFSLGQWCKSNAPPFMKSSGSNLFIDFYSDNDTYQSGEGFEAAWNSDATCGGHYTNGKGIVSSPRYPNNYPNDIFCKWTISAPDKTVIHLTFLHPFDIDDCDQCECDSLKIYDVMTDGQRMLRNMLCDDGVPSPFTTASSTLDLEFSSNGYYGLKGFSMVWTSIEKPPHTVLIATQGSLTSPSDTSAYPDNFIKRWEIIVPYLHHVVLKFNTFHLGNKDDTLCKHHRLEIFDILQNGTLYSLGKWCGTNAPPSIKSSNSNLFVDFYMGNKTDRSSYFFQAAWNNDSKCGGFFTTNNGVLSFPRYPYYSPDYRICKWNIHVDEGTEVHLTYLTSLSRYSEIGNVTVYDISAGGYQTIRDRWFGLDAPHSFNSSFNVDVELKFNDTYSFYGFYAVWFTVVPPDMTIKDCPRGPGVKDGYIKQGTNASCQCQVKPPKQPQWLDSKGTSVGKSNGDGSKSLTLRYDPGDLKPSYICKVFSPSKDDDGVTYTPKFAYGPDKVVISLNDNKTTVELCHSTTSFSVFCDISTNKVNPKPRVILEGISPNSITFNQQSDLLGIYRYEFTVTPKTDGMLTLTCVASNSIFPDIKAQEEENITVLAPPSSHPAIVLDSDISVRNDSIQTVTNGQTIVISCRLEDVHPTNKNVVMSCLGEQHVANGSTAVIVLHITKDMHHGRCKCTGCNGKTMGFSFNVQYLPTVTNFTANSMSQAIAEVGDNVTLTCHSEANPMPNLSITSQRSKNILLLNELDYGNYTKAGHLTMVMKCTDSDTYTCKAQNGIGMVEKNMSVLVKCPPAVLKATNWKEEIKFVSTSGSILVIDINILGYPEPLNYLLIKIEENLMETELERSKYTVIYKHGKDVSNGVVAVWIFDLLDEDNGQYVLKINNGLGDGLDYRFDVHVFPGGQRQAIKRTINNFLGRFHF